MESQSHCTIALSVIVIQQGMAWSGLGVASERIGVVRLLWLRLKNMAFLIFGWLLKVGDLQRLIVKSRLLQAAAVVYSDYSYSRSIWGPEKLQWLIQGRVSQSNEIDTFGKSWNKRNKFIKIHW